MKGLPLAAATLLSIGITIGQAYAFSCPSLIKAANESIGKAETAAGKITEDREKGRATAIIAEAKNLVKDADGDHKEAGAKKDAQLHYRAEAKAKAAKALADLVK